MSKLPTTRVASADPAPTGDAGTEATQEPLAGGYGTEATFSAMYRRHAGRVFGYVRRHVLAEAADDIVAEVFLAAWRRRSLLPAEPIGWLLVTARNAVSNHHRATGRRLRLAERIGALDSLASAPSAEHDALTRQQMIAALAALTDAEREVILLLAWDGLPVADAAAVAGCSPPTLTVRLHRARARLAAAIDAATTDAVTTDAGSTDAGSTDAGSSTTAGDTPAPDVPAPDAPTPDTATRADRPLPTAQEIS